MTQIRPAIPRSSRSRLPALRQAAVAITASFAALAALSNGAAAQERFPTPEAASKALIDAAKAGQPGFVDRIFGPGAAALIGSDNPAENTRQRNAFNDAAAEAATLVPRGDTTRVLQIGRNPYLFPIPIVKKGDAWVYDLEAGRTELENRRIGFNELSAIEACHTYVAAQKEYFRVDRNGDEVQEYAQRFISRPGQRDGLYWEPENQADRSPLDGRFTEAALARRGEKPEPYNGYMFRILKGQGAAAPGGAYDYEINGRLLAGFALVAYPADWGHTGIMTFICNQQDRVYQQNLGPETAKLGATLRRYNPDKSWQLVD